MTTSPTTETSARQRAGHALAAVVVVTGLGLAVGGPAGAGLGEPVDPRDPSDETTTTTAPATTVAPTSTPGDTTPAAPPDDTATTAPDATDDGEATTDEDDDGGTSAAALGAVGVVAFVLGLLVAAVPLGIALSRRKAAPRPVPPPPVPVASATPAPAPAGGIAIGPAPSRDADEVRQQRAALAEALIALRDQLPSDALRAQAGGALAAAGYVEIDPVGEPFDPSRHRAVHQVATEDPTQHDRIIAVERPGYADGRTVVRQPEVVVGRHGGGS